MNKQALLEETYRSAFEDELRKIAALSAAGKSLRDLSMGVRKKYAKKVLSGSQAPVSIKSFKGVN